MGFRRITVRVTPELHERAARAADDGNVSLNTLVVEAVEAYVSVHTPAMERWPLAELSALLAPAADAADLTADDVQRHLREVRRRIWAERYEAAARSGGTEAG